MNRAALYATELDDAYIALFTLTGEGTTVRVTDWDVNVVSGGHSYMAEAFAVVLPAASDESPPRARIRIDNACAYLHRGDPVGERGAAGNASIVAASDPEVVELGPLDFECRAGAL